MKMKSYETFALWASNQPKRHGAAIRALRKLVKKTAPKLIESVKWGNGCWLGKEYPVLFLHSEPDHLQFGFFAGAHLSDPKGILLGNGKFVRHVKVRSPGDIDEKELARLIRLATRLELSE